MHYDDKWFNEKLKKGEVIAQAQTAFRHVHGDNKKAKIVYDVLNRNLQPKFISSCREALENLDNVLDRQYAELIKYCAVVYANFCDEIYTGIDDFYYKSIAMEWLLHSESGYSKGGRYRDHLTHQLKVTLLGIDFLKGAKDIPSLMPKVVEALRLSPSLNEYLRGEGIAPNVIEENIAMASWLLAGMFHDIGYCFLMHIKTGKKLRGLSDFFDYDISREIWNKVEGLIKPHSYIVQFYKAHGEGLNENSSLEEIKERIRQSAFESKNHSVIGALYLLYMLNQFELSAEEAFSDADFKKRMRLTFELAALAILTHDIDSPSKQKHDFGADSKARLFKESLVIPFKDYPISYLLGICDQLQDWGRRRVVREPINNDCCIEKYLVDSDSEEISVRNKRLYVRFRASTSSHPVIPSYWLLGKEVSLGAEASDSADAKTLLANYKNGRAYILSSVYGPCPLWDEYSLVVEAGGTTFCTADYFNSISAKRALAS